jgi:chemotaxis protein MotA
MFAIIGIVVVFGAIVGGYLMEHGNLKVLLQPAELLIIGGAGAGTVLIANPLHILKQIASGVVVVFKGSSLTKQRYIESLKLGYELLNKARRQGLMSLETDVEEPDNSPIFSKDPEFLKNHHVRYFFCDSMRMAISGVEALELDQLMELDLEVHHHGVSQPVLSLSTMADSLPGLGIVAAVLGVVITMGALGGPPEEIGHKVAAALVGTFLGILLCYGFVGPIAPSMAKAADEGTRLAECSARADHFFLKGTAPIMAVEAARRAIPGHVRPTFSELEQACRGGGATTAPAAEEQPPPAADAAATGG